MIDYNGNGQKWTTENLLVTTNCQGNAESIRPWGSPAPCELEVQLPANLNGIGKCMAQRICILRFQNHAQNGSFGGCIPLQQLEPVAKQAVQKKPVPVPVVKPVKPVVLPPQPVSITKNNAATIIKVEISIKTVIVQTEVLPTKKLTEIGKPIWPTARPPANKKPTKEELEVGLGGEDYDDDVIEKLKNIPITDEEKEKLKSQVGQENKSPIRTNTTIKNKA
ncbi:hypothetical protein TWF506_009106 [Arthrobotrys conoides]|uniref:Uncharacterized protein n=1 Tax=Arthrobotrys conoides TaxID=74498 RepID=A0AAN8NKC6_9PEZI